MALKDTNLLIQMGALPTTFRGTPQDLAVAMLKRMKIVSPNGTNFIYIGDVEPTSNVGPWLKGGTQWWVWSEDTKRYVPLDISASETKWYFIGASVPATTEPPVWLQTTKDATEDDPTYGNPITWRMWNGSNWVPWIDIVLSGPFSTVSGTTPTAYTQFYATDLGNGVLIWYERGAWRTVSGVPGDIKSVGWPTLAGALEANPGWAFFGETNVDYRGRIIVQAAKNPDGSSAFPTSPGVAQRAAYETFGQTDNVTMGGPDVPYPPQIALWTLVKE